MSTWCWVLYLFFLHRNKTPNLCSNCFWGIGSVLYRFGGFSLQCCDGKYYGYIIVYLHWHKYIFICICRYLNMWHDSTTSDPVKADYTGSYLVLCEKKELFTCHHREKWDIISQLHWKRQLSNNRNEAFQVEALSEKGCQWSRVNSSA